MSPKKRERMLNVRITEKQYEQLQEEAASRDCYLSELVREKISGKIGGENSQGKRWQLAREAVRRIYSLSRLAVEEIWLYGSVARGEASPASDIDLLIVIEASKKKRRKYRRQIYERLMELEWEHEIHFSLQIFTARMWKDKRVKSFRREVKQTGIRFQKKAGTVIATSAA